MGHFFSDTNLFSRLRKTRDTNYSAISDHSKFRAKCPKVLQACDSG